MNLRLDRAQWELASPLSTKVMILVADGVSLTTVSSTLEPFHCANNLLEHDRFTLQLVSLSDNDPLTLAGIHIPCQTTSKEVLAHQDVIARPDLIILCCGPTLAANDEILLNNFSRKLARISVPIFAMGAGCAAIAAAGIIKTGRCAAHWKTIASLGEKFPDIDFLNEIFISNGPITSCAGEFSSFNLIVEFIELQCGTRVSGAIYNNFIANGRRSGGSVQLLNGDAMICKDQKFQNALEVMADNIEEPISMQEIAKRLGMSTRQLERIFARCGFESPRKYYCNLRLTRARQLIEQTRMSLAEIALACGFETPCYFPEDTNSCSVCHQTAIARV